MEEIGHLDWHPTETVTVQVAPPKEEKPITVRLEIMVRIVQDGIEVAAVQEQED